MTTTANAAQPLRPGSSKLMRTLTALKRAAMEWINDNVMSLSASVTFYTLLSLAPLVIIILKVLSVVFHKHNAAQQKLHDTIADQIGTTASTAIDAILSASGNKPKDGLVASIIGLVILLFGASGVFTELQQAMNTIWGVKAKPGQGIWGFLRTRLLSFGMVLGIAFLLLVSLFVSTGVAAIAKWLSGNLKIVSFAGDVVVSLLVITLLFAMIFKFLPDVKIRWKYVWLGAALTAVLFVIGKWGLSAYFRFVSPTSTYGAAGSLVMVLLWVYYSSFILFYGAEFTKVYALSHGQPIVPSENAERIAKAPDRARQRQDAPPAESGRGRPALSVSGYLNRAYPAQPRPASSRATYLAAGAGLAVGALAGAYGARKMQESAKPTEKHIAAVRLDERLKEVELKVGRVSRIRDYLQQVHVDERIDAVERQIRQAARKARKAERRSGQNGWMRRMVEKISGH